MKSTHPEGYCPVFGNYPKEYNRAVHGPYYPWVNYAPSGLKPLGEVKLGELPEWFKKQNKTPQALIAAASRFQHNWFRRYLATRYGSPVKGLFQALFFMSLASLSFSYGLIKMHRNHKYHW